MSMPLIVKSNGSMLKLICQPNQKQIQWNEALAIMELMLRIICQLS